MNRERFPGLRDGWARLDGPAGTQMVDTAIAAMHDHVTGGSNANGGGRFDASIATAALVDDARDTVARLLGADAAGVVFGDYGGGDYGGGGGDYGGGGDFGGGGGDF